MNKETIVIHGLYRGVATFIEIHVNNELVYNDYIKPHQPLIEEFNQFGQEALAVFKIIPSATKHFDQYKIKCTEGNIAIGHVYEDFFRDISHDVDAQERYNIYQRRLANLPALSKQYTFYNKHETVPRMYNNRINITMNNEPVEMVHDDEYSTNAGWVFEMEKGDVLEFDIDTLIPFNGLTFMVDCQPGVEYFEKDL